MSGGSWEYVCYKVADAAGRLCDDKCMHRRAFGLHLRKVAEALHDIEWVDSNDKSPGDEIPAIMTVITPTDVLNSAAEDADRLIESMNRLLKQIRKLSREQ